MVDVPLMRVVLRALPERAALLLVGDVDQLPSVGRPSLYARSDRRIPFARRWEVFQGAAAENAPGAPRF